MSASQQASNRTQQTYIELLLFVNNRDKVKFVRLQNQHQAKHNKHFITKLMRARIFYI